MRVSSVNSYSHVDNLINQLEAIAKSHDLSVQELLEESKKAQQKEPYQARAIIIDRRLKSLGIKVEEQ